MARASSNKLYRNFTAGLITETTPLTYPDNASVNEDNCVIFNKGNRSRRLGYDFEVGATLSGFTLAPTSYPNTAFQEFAWLAVANQAGLNFLVLQQGSTLYFYDMSVSPLSTGQLPFTINLNTIGSPSSTPALIAATDVYMAAGRGYLFVVGAQIEPIVVTYDPRAATVSATRLYIQIRDFKGVNDGLANDDEPSTLSGLHNYNLLNQGWFDPKNDASGSSVSYFDAFGNLGTHNQPPATPITTYYTKWTHYPGNNKQWWVAKNSSTGAFDPTLLSTFFFGTGRAPRGHYVVNAFYIDRSAMSGIAGIPVEQTNHRPSSTTFFAGRVWYGCDSTVYYSQNLDDVSKAGMCYQEADPTSEDISDLVATDGGVIQIPEMTNVCALYPLGAGVLAFASNGVWFISGATAGFSATDVAVTKISSIGMDAPNSIVQADNKVIWWSKIGVQALNQINTQFGVGSNFNQESLSENTIRTFFQTIPDQSRQFAKGVYDPASNTIQWLYQSGTYASPYFYNRILNLDLTLKAFYPWTVSDSGAYVTGIFTTPFLNILSQPTSIRNTFNKFVNLTASSGNTTFGFFNNFNYADWQTLDGVGKAYTSFVETGYELLDDAMRKKEANYVFCYFRRTEANFVPSSSDYTVDAPSHCFLQVKWDWSDSEISNKWSTKMEAYRHRRQPEVDATNLTFDTGSHVVVSRNKVRGSGKSIQFRFENGDIGSNFDLLGWAVPYSGNTDP